jgi:hypothetical protein
METMKNLTEVNQAIINMKRAMACQLMAMKRLPDNSREYWQAVADYRASETALRDFNNIFGNGSMIKG